MPTFTFANVDAFDSIDYVVVAVATVFLLGYHALLSLHNRRMPHTSLPSHIDYFQLTWSRWMGFDHPNERIAIIQNMRSNIMIVACFSNMVLVGGALVSRSGFKQSVSTAHVIRCLVPCGLLLTGFFNYVVVALSWHHLHFIYTLEEVQRIASVPPSIQTPDTPSSMTTEPPSSPQPCAPVDEAPVAETMRMSKMHGASLVTQAAWHNRLGWRFTVSGLVLVLWPVCPYVVPALVIIMVFHTAWNDFPFPSSVNEMFVPDDLRGAAPSQGVAAALFLQARGLTATRKRRRGGAGSRSPLRGPGSAGSHSPLHGSVLSASVLAQPDPNSAPIAVDVGPMSPSVYLPEVDHHRHHEAATVGHRARGATSPSFADIQSEESDGSEEEGEESSDDSRHDDGRHEATEHTPLIAAPLRPSVTSPLFMRGRAAPQRGPTMLGASFTVGSIRALHLLRNPHAHFSPEHTNLGAQ